MQVLVTWASRHGSTAGNGERIADRLRLGDGLRVTARAIGDQPGDRAGGTAPFDAVVVGSAIHDQAWLPEAARFVTGHATDLRDKPVWLYSVGMPGAFGPRLRRLAMREGPVVVAPFESLIRPRGTALFTGALRAQDLPRLGRVALRLAGGRFGDHRDWLAIDAWADDVRRALLSSSAGARRQ